MDIAAYTEYVKLLPFGKKLPQATYVYAPDSSTLPPELGSLVDRLRVQYDLPHEFNVVKFSHDGGVSFLNYPRFHGKPHPELKESFRVSLVTGKVSRSRFGSDGNPPILHRKEAFVPDRHPDAETWARMTLQEEAAGLYDYPVTIGFKAVWEGLLTEKSLAYRGHDLIERDSGTSIEQQPIAPLVYRSRTAIFRSGLSKPIRLAIAHGLITEGTTIFDYGCGRGGDAELLRDHGYTVAAWDPAFFPDNPKARADVVNLGYVLNVIETPRERLEVLLDAWAHTAKVLVVSTLIKGQEGHSHATVHGDGVITSRNTFQKYFEQGELQGFIESALDCEAHALSLGVFAAFRSPQMAQTFSAQRRRRGVEWNKIRSDFAPKRRARQPRIVAVYEQHAELLDSFWRRSLELGRVPKPTEFARIDELRASAGPPGSVHRLLLEHHGAAAFDEAKQRRKEDLLVYLALAGFGKRIPQKHLDAQLQEDLKTFFGGYAQAQEAGRNLLMSLSAEDALWESACSLPFGWRDSEERHFAIHGSLLDSLPPPLRVFVECGSILYGDPHEADIIKLHLRSRKVSFLIYDDFFRLPFPELKTRIKVDLARAQVAVFEYGYALPPQLLFYKERFVSADHPLRKRMELVSKRLRKIGISREGLGVNDENAPGKAAFRVRLSQLGLRADLTKRPPTPTSATEPVPRAPASQFPGSGGTS